MCSSHRVEVVADERRGRLVSVRLASAALPRPAHVEILLPDGYDDEPDCRYPVILLLHGGLGSNRDWIDHGHVEEATAGRPVIVVMPEGGRGGWYQDWRSVGARAAPAWATFHLDQLIGWVDDTYRTLGTGATRAVAGVSMGGYGALSYAARRPGTFAVAASFSGAVDLTVPAVRALVAVSPVIDGGLPGAVFGLPGRDGTALRATNPVQLAERLRGTDLILTTGNGRPGPLDGARRRPSLQELHVHAMNVRLHRRLDDLAIDHRFVDRGPGCHQWGYWAEDLARELPAILQTVTPQMTAQAPSVGPSGAAPGRR